MKIWINKAIEGEPSSDYAEALIFNILDTASDSNIQTNFEEIWGVFSKDCLDPIYEDLLIIAASVYAVDKKIPRSGIFIGDSFDNWTRNINISVPVIDINSWLKVKGELEEALHFLSGDVWDFSFRSTEKSYRKGQYNGKEKNKNNNFDGVSLFSGGLDSFSGAIKLLEDDQNICFVSCREYKPLSQKIHELYNIVSEEYPNKNTDIIIFNADPKLPSNVSEEIGKKLFENTSRSRSFLFIAAALAVASLVGKSVPVYVPENGFIGLNIPLTASRIGSCSTRTTHSYFLNLYNAILEKLSIDHKIINIFGTKTKGEVIDLVKEKDAFKRGADKTISCSHPMRGDKGIPGRPKNCGYCFPCLIRRASLNNIEINEIYDDLYNENYKISKKFILNEKYEDPQEGKTRDLKAVLYALHDYIKHGSTEYYDSKLIKLGGLSLDEIKQYTRIYIKSMEELYAMIKSQAEKNGLDLLEYVEK